MAQIKPSRLLLATAITVASVSSLAQDNALEEVIVTAERRAVSVQDIPISAVVLSGDMINNRGINTFEQLQYNVPSLVFTDNGNSKFVNIRGVGVSESAPNQTVGVAVHLDGAYVAREFVYGDAFFDLSSIEVLRGPQGTYSGQNAAGGAIFINSRKPSFDSKDGFLEAELGEYDKQRLSGGVSFALTDTLAARISGDWEERDSFYSNHGADLSTPASRVSNQPGNIDRHMARLQLLYAPNDNTEIRLIHEISDNKTDGVPYQYYETVGTNNTPDNPWDLNYDLSTRRYVEYDRTTLTLDWAATDFFKVVANISTLESQQDIIIDSDLGSPVTDPTAQQDARDFLIEDDYWTAEVSLVSTGDGPLEWTVGGSYLDYQQDNYLNFMRYNTAQYPNTSIDPINNTRLYFYLDNRRENSAVFGEVGYQITPTLQVKAGLRYNEDEVGFDSSSYIAPGPFAAYNATVGLPIPAQELLEFDATTGRVLVNWEPNDDTLIYATVSRGYKPGGTTPFANEYEEEEVTNYEIGWKGDLMDSITGSVSVFYMEYEGFQRTYSPDPDNPALSVTRNVDGTTISGVELQFSGVIADHLRWDVTAAYNDGEYGDLAFVAPPGSIDGTNPLVPTLFNLDGEPLDYLPELSYNLGLSWMGLQIGDGELIPSVRVSYQDEYYQAYYHYDQNLVEDRTLVDAFLAYESNDGWRAEMYALNLFDEEYVSRTVAGDNALGQYLFGAPRQWGFKLRYNF